MQLTYKLRSEVAMLTESEFNEWSASLSLSEIQYTLIQSIRSSPPSRRVKGRVGNVIGRYPSKKMGVVIQFESHRNELALIYEMEYDSDVLEYYDQPPKIKLQYSCINGRQVGVLHTPDFFVIRRNSAGWEECKTVSELENLSSKMPNRYQLDSNGDWRCPPGEISAKNFGLYYQIRDDKKINWKKQRNIYFLEDYLSIGFQVPTSDIVEVVKIISQTPGIKLSELLERGINCDYIFKLIADQTVYIDLESFSICSESERIGVFLNRETASAFTAINNNLKSRNFSELTLAGAIGVWDGQIWHVVNVGETTVTLLSESSQIIQLPKHEFNQLIEQDKFKALYGQSPRSMFESGLVKTGLRSHKIISYDDNFKIFTLPTTTKGTAKVIPNNGVKINNIYYWHNIFRNPEVEKTQVSVRYDPYNMGIAYVYVKNQWLTCISQHYSSLAGHSEREIMMASEELRKQKRYTTKQFIVTASSLAEFLKKSEQQELILLQRIQDMETKEIYNPSPLTHNLVQEELEPQVLELPMKQPNIPENIPEEIKPYEEFW